MGVFKLLEEIDFYKTSGTTTSTTVDTENTTPSITDSIKEINTPTPRKKNKANNVNIIRANTVNQQQIPQSQETNDSFNQQAKRNAFQNLQNDMLQTAQQIARSRHQNSNLQECSSSGSNFVLSQTQYERIYNCRLKGKILGIRSFEVGVKVRGEIVKQGSSFFGQVVDADLIYDREL